MAVRRKGIVRPVLEGPQPVMRKFFRKNRGQVIAVGAAILAGVVALAFYYGLRVNADLKASELFSRARTVEDFQRILRVHPKSNLTFSVLINLGNLCHDQGKPQEAQKYYQEALSKFPKGLEGASASCALGILAGEAKDYTKAAGFFNQAVALAPKSIKAAEALHTWGRYLEIAKDAAGASEKYSRIERDFPGSPWAREAAWRLKKIQENPALGLISK